MAHSRFLGFARNDKKERVVVSVGLLPWDSAVVGAAGTPYFDYARSLAEKSRRLGSKRPGDLSHTRGLWRAVEEPVLSLPKEPRRCFLADAIRSFPTTNYKAN